MNLENCERISSTDKLTNQRLITIIDDTSASGISFPLLNVSHLGEISLTQS